MDLRTALMKDILNNPEDDTPRLVFADWLEDNARTEEIVIEANKIREGIRNPHLITIAPMWDIESTIELKWRRGFIEEIKIHTFHLPRVLSGIFMRHPIQRVTFWEFIGGIVDGSGGKVTVLEYDPDYPPDKPNQHQRFSHLVLRYLKKDKGIKRKDKVWGRDRWIFYYHSEEDCSRSLNTATIMYGRNKANQVARMKLYEDRMINLFDNSVLATTK